jgi:hypothetical protein
MGASRRAFSDFKMTSYRMKPLLSVVNDVLLVTGRRIAIPAIEPEDCSRTFRLRRYFTVAVHPQK